MSVQKRTDRTIRNYNLGKDIYRRGGFIVEQDAGRDADTDLAIFTPMAWNAAHTKINPLTDITAVDGSQIPMGLMAHPVDAALIIAGDVEDCEVYEFALSANESLIVPENSVEIDDKIQIATVVPTIATADASDLATAITLVNAIKTAINAGVVLSTIREELAKIGIQTRIGEFVNRAENS